MRRHLEAGGWEQRHFQAHDAVKSAREEMKELGNFRVSLLFDRPPASQCIHVYVSPKMRTVPVRELGSQFAN